MTRETFRPLNLVCAALVLAAPMALLYPIVLRGAIPTGTSNAVTRPFLPGEDAAAGIVLPDLPDKPFTQRYYPSYAFLNDAMSRGESLLWNPLDNGGRPFFARWESRVLSPFTIPFYFLRLETALAVSILIKMAVAGFCAYYLARKYGVEPPLALVTAVFFEASPVFLYAPYEPLADTVAWLPLLIVYAERLSTEGPWHWWRAALVVTLMLLGGSVAGVLGALFLVAAVAVFHRLLVRPPQIKFRRVALAIVGPFLVAGLMSAIQIVPYMEVLTQLGLPSNHGGASGVAGIIPGPLSLALVALWLSVRQAARASVRQRVDTLLIVWVLLMALVAYRVHYEIPVLAYAHPAVLVAMTHLILAISTAVAAQEWLRLDPVQTKSAISRLALFLPLVIGCAGALVTVYSPASNPGFTVLLTQALHGLPFVMALIVLFAVTTLYPRPAFMGFSLTVLIGIHVTVIALAPLSFTHPRDLFPDFPFVKALKQYDERITVGEGTRRWPLLAYGIPATDLTSSGDADLSIPSSYLLLTKRDLQGDFGHLRPRLKLLHVFSFGAALFEMSHVSPRAYVVGPGRSWVPDRELGEGADDALVWIEEGHTKVGLRVTVHGPAVLTLKDRAYPGWKATINDAGASIDPTAKNYRSVRLKGGENDVVFYYDPLSFKVGVGLTLLGTCLVLAAAAWSVFGPRRRGAAGG